MGSVISNSVGGAEPDEESRSGGFFHAFLARTGMALLALFRGGGGTWQDRMRRWHRLDHVGVACGELQAVSRVEVDQDGVLAVQEREDHRLVTVLMQWSFQRRAAPFPTHASGESRRSGPRRRWSGPLRSEGVHLQGDAVGASRSRLAEEHLFSRRASAQDSSAQVCASEMESE